VDLAVVGSPPLPSAGSRDYYGSVATAVRGNSGGSCYPYAYDDGGFFSEFRTISYGRAKCHWPYSNQTVYVFFCETSNE
jgi:hypothetical protein